MDQQTTLEIEAQTFRRLLKHLSEHSEVQNIDLMLLASFCRNCIAKWYLNAANEHGQQLNEDQARQLIYGMPYTDWKKANQIQATPEQIRAYNEKHKK